MIWVTVDPIQDHRLVSETLQSWNEVFTNKTRPGSTRFTLELLMQITSQTQSAIAPTQPGSTPSPLKTTDMVGILLVTVPLLGLLGIVSYRKYRNRLIKQQMATLERIWKLNSIEKTP